MLVMQISLIAGPALAGLVAAAGGLKVCYRMDALSFAAALYGVARLPAMRPEAAVPAGLRSVADGLRFIGRSRVLTGGLLTDLNAMVLAMPVALFPAINADRFGGSPRTLGLLTTALAVGGVARVGAVRTGRAGGRQGRGMLAMVALWGRPWPGSGRPRGRPPSICWRSPVRPTPVASSCARPSFRWRRRMPTAAGSARPSTSSGGLPGAGQLPGGVGRVADHAVGQRALRRIGVGGGSRLVGAGPAGAAPLPRGRDAADVRRALTRLSGRR